MNHYTEIPRTLQMEISSNCNINCLGCVRTDKFSYDIKGNPDIPKNKFLSLDTFRDIINSPASVELREVQFCGSIDDPLMHPDFLSMVEILKERNIRTLIHTNASLRTPEYFAKLAGVLNGKVQFSIDGLEHTNHLYRRGAIWNKIMANAEAFIAAGGNAQWQYIEFPWNEQDTDDAKMLATEMGFKSFKYRRDRSGSPDPTTDELTHAVNRARRVNAMSWQEYVEKEEQKQTGKEIECFSREQKMYFIGFDGRVWPCCFLHNARWNTAGNYQEVAERYSNNYAEGWNDLNVNSFEQIVHHEFYAQDLTASWDSSTHGTGPQDRIIRCTQTCSKKSKCDRPIGNFKVDALN
jgi:MoaA/NifB/PqqE/SkfB family radical SAM enzyme